MSTFVKVAKTYDLAAGGTVAVLVGDEADERATVFHTIRYWHCNWMIALENTLDAHNCFWVHRNAISQLRNRFGGRPRTPLGYRTKIVNNKAAWSRTAGGQRTITRKDGTIPYQMYYPRTGGYWPPTRFRLLWIWFFEWRNRQKQTPPKFETPEEWAGGLHLPSMQRLFSARAWRHVHALVCAGGGVPDPRRVLRSRRVRTHVGQFGSGSPLPCIATGCKTTISPTRTTMPCTRPATSIPSTCRPRTRTWWPNAASLLSTRAG